MSTADVRTIKQHLTAGKSIAFALWLMAAGISMAGAAAWGLPLGGKILAGLACGYLLWTASRFARLGSAIYLALRQFDVQANVWNQPLVWKDTVCLWSEAYYRLQQQQPRLAYWLQQYTAYDTAWLKCLPILPGHRFFERYCLWRAGGVSRPLRVIPQLQRYVWGAPPDRSYILKFFGKTCNAPWVDKIAEMWFGAHPKNPGIVIYGPWRLNLDRLIRFSGSRILGHPAGNLPQLFKILDSAQPLSFQMHYREMPHAKSECWMVWLDRIKTSGEKDQNIAEVYVGLRPVKELSHPELDEFRRKYLALPTAAEQAAYYRDFYGRMLDQQSQDPAGELVKAFHNRIQVKRVSDELELYFNGVKQGAEIKQKLGLNQGRMIINIPGATAHTLQSGMVFEVQEPEDKTLRLYDYGRQDPLRPLQIREAVEKIDATPRSPLAYCLEPVAWDARTANLICDSAYAVDEILTEPGQPAAINLPGSFCMLVITAGEGSLRPAAGTSAAVAFRQGDMFIVPAECPAYQVQAAAKVRMLRIYSAGPEQMLAARQQRGKQFWEKD